MSDEHGSDFVDELTELTAPLQKVKLRMLSASTSALIPTL